MKKRSLGPTDRITSVNVKCWVASATLIGNDGSGGRAMLFRTDGNLLRGTALLCCALIVPGEGPLMAQQPPPSPAAAEAPTPIPADQLDSLVAPIALYPDPLLAQVLAASTYPLEIVQLQQWLAKHKDLKDKALADAVKKENWDPSIQSMAALPDVVKQLADNIKWTSELGNAFLAQQSDVMDAVQRMRAKAKDAGKLKSNEQMKVETKVVESKSVVVIEQANPQVVYVPSYDPVVVWGAAPVMRIRRSSIRRWVLRGRYGAFLRRWSCHGSNVGRRLGLWLRMGRQQQRSTSTTTTTSQQQQSDNNNGNGSGNRIGERQRQLAAQSAAPRRSSLRRQGDGQ